jgi:RecT family
MAVHDLERIEEKIDRAKAGAVAVSDSVGGIMFQNMAEVMEFSKLLSLAGTAVPKHLRGNPGGCLAVTIQALEWHMSPVAVANKSYEVGDRIAYESQLIHGVIEARAPLKQRLRGEWKGEGAGRFIIVTGHLRGEVDPLIYESPPIEKIKVKNSPLWVADPDQQLWYYGTRAWARRYCPDVLLGIYSEEELRELEVGAEHARDVTPKPDVGSRLKGSKAKGFAADNVDRALEHKPGTELPQASTAPEPQPVAVASASEPVPEQQMSMATDAGDIETEIRAKVAAIGNADTPADVNALLDSGKAFLAGKNRGDLLGELMSAADKRLKKVKG